MTPGNRVKSNGDGGEAKAQVPQLGERRAELKVIASGHRMHIEDPELFANTVKDYLGR